ncbi:MAG TPA: Ig-like domain-containing protein, partial [Candidatus Dormibacteraeota bacterium]|nr:Ig-like domain-containing protein [Candidatus Dormibacteraeota bacterium]
MNSYHDPEMDDVLQDDELRHLATLLQAVRVPEAPLDDAFRTGLRRELMQQAWAMTEGRDSWWRRTFAPPGIAWAGAAAGLVLIATLVVWFLAQPQGSLTYFSYQSAIDGKSNVALNQAILVSFDQPMDHRSTEDAVQITPATTVTFSWQDNTLVVQPTSGNLAPNTQYQVTIGQGARTSSGQPLTAQQTITFVTQPPAPPTPSPSPHPTPISSSLLTGEKQLVSLGGATTAQVQWSADSSSIYYVDGHGALNVVPAKGGSPSVIAPDGATGLTIAPSGDRLAYVRAGKIEVLSFADGKTDEITPPSAPTLVGWARNYLIWAATDGIYSQQQSGPPVLVMAQPLNGRVTYVSIASD